MAFSTSKVSRILFNGYVCVWILSLDQSRIGQSVQLIDGELFVFDVVLVDCFGFDEITSKATDESDLSDLRVGDTCKLQLACAVQQAR